MPTIWYFGYLFWPAFELISPLILSTGLEVTNFIFGLLVVTLEITCTVNLSKSEINLYSVYTVFLFLKIQRYLRTLSFHFPPD